MLVSKLDTLICSDIIKDSLKCPFHYTMHNLIPKLKFKIEKLEITSNALELLLLHFKVTISKDGKCSFEVYKKKAKKPLFVHRQ